MTTELLNMLKALAGQPESDKDEPDGNYYHGWQDGQKSLAMEILSMVGVE